MVEPQSSRFWQAAIRSGLLDEAALQHSWDEIPQDKRTLDAVDRRLARQIVNAGRLTIWQAQQMLAGRWQGLKIDRYELQDIIGHGGMGRVYLARDAKLGRRVALKILSRERMNNPRALTRFRREAKVGAQLQHENLVRIYDEGESHGVRYLVMEYIEGKTVGKLIVEHGRLPPATAASLGRQVALGLEHLHVKGLLHRDVNPLNILVDRDGTAKLTDLGLAIDLGDLDDVVTRDGATVGTFDYISPEQARHSRSVGPAADLYSLGCTIYHMIAGRVPFPSPSLPEKLYAHQLNEPEPLAQLAPGTPDGLAAVVARLMRKTPEERYARAADAARALDPFTTGGSFSAEELSVVSSSPPGEADVPSGATPDGSDPDLDLRPASPTTPASETSDVASKVAFLPKIDFGPEPSLSESRGGRTVAKPRPKPKSMPDAPAEPEQPRRPFPIRPVAIGAGGVAALALVVTLVVLYLKQPPRSKVVPTKSTVADVNKGKEIVPNPPPAEVAIRYSDGTESPQDDLRQAIVHLGGGGGEIVLRPKKPINVGDLKTSLKLVDGHLVIRAADGARPDLAVVLSEKMPWIEVAPRAKLTLVGLSFRISLVASADAKAPALPPSVIASSGRVALDRCAFSLTGDDRSARLLSAEGLEARATGCFFEGFDRPINLAMYPGAEGRFSQCLFVRDVSTNPLSGWAFTVTVKNTPQTRPRKLFIDRCTALGAGLLAADGFTADSPLTVTATNNAVRTSAVLLTAIPAAALPKAIAWTGKENAYALNGAAWIVLPPNAFDGLKGGPSDLKSWTELMNGDVNGRDEAMKFAGASTSEGHPPEDFAVFVEKRQSPVGADPAKVGP